VSYPTGTVLGITLQRLVFFHHPALKVFTFSLRSRGVVKPAAVVNDLLMALYDERSS
jgi:hypothetical protein